MAKGEWRNPSRGTHAARDKRRGSGRPRVPADSVSGSFLIHSVWPAMLLLGASLLLLSLIFPPVGLWPLAYVGLVPWVLVVGASAQARRIYVLSYLLGLAFFLANLTWICTITVHGYAALCIYAAVYFPLMACPIRHAVRRRRVPLVLALPVVWTGAEFVRSIVMTGFPWFLLAHSQHRFLTLIQISDLVGAYGVSFIVAMVNGAVADVLFAFLRARRTGERSASRRFALRSVGAAVGVLAAVSIYGQVQLHRDTATPGPRVAVIQGDYPLHTTLQGPSPNEKAARYFALLQQAADEDPDLFLLPETPWHMYLNREFLDLDPGVDPSVAWSRWCFDTLQSFAVEKRAYVITGAASKEPTPMNMRADGLNYNSAFVIKPDGSEPERYDKVHLVPFGETIPFRYGRFRFLYIWFNSLSPFGQDFEYSLTPGKSFKVFEITPPAHPDRPYRFGIPICYEDVMPYVSRRFVIGPDGRKRVDFLLNISNDGWFLHTNELPQHLAVCTFRAVENRVAIARAVNTGISGFIDPDGRIHHLVTDAEGRYHGPGIDGFQVAVIQVDSRCSLYSRTGDVFAMLCAAFWIIAYLDYTVARMVGTRSGTSGEDSP